MNQGALVAATGLAAEDGGHVLIASADADGRPHLATADEATVSGPGLLTITAWFCPGTLANLSQNPHLTVLTWKPSDGRGYQLVGQVESVEEVAVLNGYSPEIDSARNSEKTAGQRTSPEDGEAPIPQVQRRLQLRVTQVFVFTDGPHRDRLLSSTPHA